MDAQEKQPAPDWAPDNCPPSVVKLITDEQYLEDLGLRGLSSADSGELHQAVRKLQGQFALAFQRGLDSVPRARVVQLLALGWLFGVLCGAWTLAIVFDLPI